MPVALLERRKATAFARALQASGTVADPACARLVQVATELPHRQDGDAVPTEAFRAELRERLVAAATLAAEQAADQPRLGRAARRRRPRRPVRGRWRRRLITSAVGVAMISAAAAGIAVASENALPGEWLYPVKRTVERAELALPGSQAQRGQRYLDQANARLWEVQQTLSRAGAKPMNPHTVNQLGTTLDSMRSSVQRGGALITSGFVPAQGDAGLRRLSGFINAQRAPVAALENQLPEPLANRAPSLLALFNQLGEQVTQLSKGTVSVPLISAPAHQPASRHESVHPLAEAPPHPELAPGGGNPEAPSRPEVTPSHGQPPTTGVLTTPTAGLTVPPLTGSAPSHAPVGLHITIGGTPRKGNNDIELPPVLPGLPSIGIGLG
jgi:hypothetical protein